MIPCHRISRTFHNSHRKFSMFEHVAGWLLLLLLSKSNFSSNVIYAKTKIQLNRCSTLNRYWQTICAKSFEYYINYAYKKQSSHHWHHTIWWLASSSWKAVKKKKKQTTFLLSVLTVGVSNSWQSNSWYKLTINFWFN